MMSYKYKAGFRNGRVKYLQSSSIIQIEITIIKITTIRSEFACKVWLVE